jgi:hypothetical protein
MQSGVKLLTSQLIFRPLFVEEGAFMRTPILNFAFLSYIVVAFANCVPACYAQAVAAPERAAAPVQRTPMRPGVRYTTGSYIVSGPGWEKQLTSGNPNLKNWSWIPVVGYSQSTGTTSRQAQQAPTIAEHKSVYVKPIHIALPTVNHGTPKVAVKPEPVQPIHLNRQTPAEDNYRADTRTQAVLSYVGDYHGTGADGFHASSNVHGVLAHRSVGAVLSQSIRY